MQPIALRPLTAEEAQSLERLAHSRTAPARAVERARIIWAVHQGEGGGAIATARGVDPETVRRWLKRFNTCGLPGLEDRPRPGRHPTYSPEQVAEIIAVALTKPAALGQPFAAWTLDRLVAYLAEQKGITMKRTRLDEVLRAEGLRWRKQDSWFGERVDPAFAEKRGASNGSTLRHQTAASSSASTRWGGPRGRRASRGGSSSAPRPAPAARLNAPGRRSTTGGAATATSSARSGPPLGRR
jgi:transposase